MKSIKRLVSSLLVIIMLMTTFLFAMTFVSSAYTNRSFDDAIDWIIARGNESWWNNVDNMHGCQCVDLAMAYYDYLLGYHLGGNACDYLTNDLPYGWYMDRIPSPGSLIVWGGNTYIGNGQKTPAQGHIGIVYSVAGSTVYTVETNQGGDKGGVNAYARFIERQPENAWYIHPFQDYNTAPSYCSLSIDKENLLIGENFTLTATSDVYSEYYISIFDMDSGEVVDNGNIVRTYTNAFQRAGHYGAYITAYNEYGSIDSKWIHFYVFGTPPTQAQLKIDKTSVIFGEKVTLKTNSDSFYVKIYISIFNKDVKVYEGNIPYTFTYTPTTTGKYSCYVTAYTHEGGVDSNWVSFIVEDNHTHSYISEITVYADCLNSGTILYTCDCGDTYTETVPALGHISGKVIETVAPTCTTEGTNITYCELCGKELSVETVPVTNHSWSDWILVSAPTISEDGEQLRYCKVCKTSDIETIPAVGYDFVPEISVDNYIVTITYADQIKDLRYALGEYTTTTEIRNAEGNVAISEALVKKYTVDGNFVYEMPKGGYYTVWIRMQDGTNYILPLDVTHFTPTVSAYGVKVILHDLYDVKDFYIAKGEYQTYREIKDNGYIVSITGAKIGDKHDYTYTVYEPGVHTILIRYNDGTQALFHETLTVDEPVFTTNGLQVTVSNLPDVKVIRTAYGEWNTVKELKATDSIRNFSAKTAIKGKDPYTIQYREEGMVTVIVEYNNGYQKVFHYEVTQKTPTVEQNGNTVTFSDLDGLVTLRYAEGEYTTSNQIKNAKGSKALKLADVVDGKISVTLERGTYTFCVQYDDESYNYYTVMISDYSSDDTELPDGWI